MQLNFISSLKAKYLFLFFLFPALVLYSAFSHCEIARVHLGVSLGKNKVNIESNAIDDRLNSISGDILLRLYLNRSYGLEVKHGGFSDRSTDLLGNVTNADYEFKYTSFAFLAQYDIAEYIGLFVTAGIINVKSLVEFTGQQESYYTYRGERVPGTPYETLGIDFDSADTTDEINEMISLLRDKSDELNQFKFEHHQQKDRESSVDYGPIIGLGVRLPYCLYFICSEKHGGISFDVSYYEYSPRLLGSKFSIGSIKSSIGIFFVF